MIYFGFFVNFGGSYIHNLFIGGYSTTFSLIIKNALHFALNQYYRERVITKIDKEPYFYYSVPMNEKHFIVWSVLIFLAL